MRDQLRLAAIAKDLAMEFCGELWGFGNLTIV
jgi:hypothetical protein